MRGAGLLNGGTGSKGFESYPGGVVGRNLCVECGELRKEGVVCVSGFSSIANRI